MNNQSTNKIILLAALITFLGLTVSNPSNAQNIGERTFRFKDESRNRPVVTEVWYPTPDTATLKTIPGYPFIHIPTVRNSSILNQKYPLILISHGTGGGRMTLEWLADKLVKNGFIVAAIDHFGNTYDNKIAIDFLEPWQRPLDISYALTCLLQDTTFGNRIDEAKIGAAGFSIGGYTVIALAGGKLNFDILMAYFNTPGGKNEAAIPEFPDLMNHIDSNAVVESFKKSLPLKDSRIKAFFAICPAIGQGFSDKKQFADVHAPIYIVGAQSDSIAPVKTNAQHYHALINGSKLMIVEGKVGHYVFLNEAVDEVKKQSPFIFADDASVNRHEIHEKVGQLAADFFKSSLK